MTRHSAEEWKARALYEEARRRHVEDELVRIRDKINGILLAAARDEGVDRSGAGADMPDGGDFDRDLMSVGAGPATLVGADATSVIHDLDLRRRQDSNL